MEQKLNFGIGIIHLVRAQNIQKINIFDRHAHMFYTHISFSENIAYKLILAFEWMQTLST